MVDGLGPVGVGVRVGFLCGLRDECTRLIRSVQDYDFGNSCSMTFLLLESICWYHRSLLSNLNFGPREEVVNRETGDLSKAIR